MATVLKLDEDLTRRVQEYAERYERSPEAVLHEVISDFVDREDEADERRFRDAVKGWDEYKRTGLHITGEEFFEWASRLGTDRETKMPECHT